MALSPQFGSIVPSQVQEALASNFLSFNGGANPGDSDSFAQQYLPEIYEAEVERYGNRTLSGFLRMVGAELPMTSDQVIWSEQNRLHIAYDNCTFAAPGVGAANAITIPAGVTNVISPRSTIVVMDDFGNEAKCLVVSSNLGAGPVTINVDPYTAANLAGAGLVGNVKIFVYGSEYRKGQTTPNAALGAAPATGNEIASIDPAFSQFSNRPVIIRDKYVVSGSDTAQIGWIEVSTEDGTGGYLWYLKAESETRLRFEDYLEMVCVEAELVAAASPILVGEAQGSEGLFAAIEARGNVQVGFSAATGISDFDDILRNLDPRRS